MTDPKTNAYDAADRVVAVCDVLADIADAGFDEFAEDTPMQWAVEMGLIRIGEAVNRIPAEILEQFPHQRWRQIVAMRNLAAHQHADLDSRRVWRTLTQDVPTLRDYLVGTVIPGLQP